ncbi:MAG: DUF2628 domain-containing protein [Romboutsia sp.]|uniref:DUF2628 domain-containing protein n=1 Tax=Romboutsia sp. TaxID=1965302 RepID=UPI003F319509
MENNTSNERESQEYKSTEDNSQLTNENINEEINNDTEFCTQCGTLNKKGGNFCIKCGSIMKSKSTSNNYVKETNNGYNKQTYDNYDKKEVESFVFKNTEYYMPKFEQMKSTGQQISWNWISFLIPSYWALYRKMYLVGLILLGINIILPVGPIITLSLNIVISVGFGMYGNSLYLTYIQRKLDTFKYLDKNMKDIAISKNGGVNLILPVAIASIGFIVIILGLLAIGMFAAFVYGY